MKKSELKQIIKEAILEEAKAPNNSVNGMIGNLYLYFDGIVVRGLDSKYIKAKSSKTVSSDVWMTELNGYSKSDVSVDGYVSMTTYPKNMELLVTCVMNHTMRGKNEKTWNIGFNEDVTKYAKEVSSFIMGIVGQ